MINGRVAVTYGLEQRLCRVSEDERESENNCRKRNKRGKRVVPVENEETCKENTHQCNANKNRIQLRHG